MTQNTYYNQIFAIYSGFVYEFIGSVDDGISIQTITENFVSELVNKQVQINVTQLPNGRYLLHSFDDIISEKFNKIADLNYREPLIPIPQEDSMELQEQSQPQI